MLLTTPAPTESVFEEMKRYVRFTEDDVAVLNEFRAHAAPHFGQIAIDFYERLREHERANDVFSGDEQVKRLQRSLVRWMERICAGPYDEAYFEETAKIGRMHVRVGVPQRYVFTAMALIRVSLERIADDTMGAKAAAVRSALARALDMEIAVMFESYRDDLVARIRRVEREELGRDLARAERRYAHAVELARVLVVGLDAHGKIRLFNREAERVTGFERTEVIGAPFIDTLLPQELVEEHGGVLRSAVAGEPLESDVLESALRTRAGKIRDVRWQLAHDQGSAEDEVVLFAIGQDKTDENALALRVRQSEKLAAVGTLAAGLAHEIRNPLNGAHLHVTFLERGLRRAGFKDEDTLEAVRVVGEEIKRLSNLVSEFLDFARPKPLAKKPVSLCALCDRVLQLVAPSAAEAGALVQKELPSSDIVLDLDGAKMEQVLLNLLSNAIEAVHPLGGGMVICRVARQPRFAVIEIEDGGPGLPSSDAPIFDPFFSTKAQGTGLGLAIAHRIVTDHDGTISVTSRPGKTVFRVTIPLPLSG
jgi:PAS domain S-box-containing protein